MDCIVVAGGRPQPGDPLFIYTQGKPKALVDMGGRTMLERVIDALQDARYIDEIVVIGLESDDGLTLKRPVHFVPDQGGLVNNAVAGVDWLRENRPAAQQFLACSADIPLATGAMIDAYIESCRPFDHGMYYIFVTREAMEARFPGSNRTFTRLMDLEVAGGDLVVVQFSIVYQNRELWEMLAEGRKHAWKLARGVGLSTLFKLLIHRLTLHEIEQTAFRLTGASARALVWPQAELAMDGDKPHQIDLLRAELERISATQNRGQDSDL